MIELTMLGRIGGAAQIKDFNGERVVVFSVYESRRRETADGTPTFTSTWVDCYYRGKEEIAKELVQGANVFVRGSMSLRIYDGREGKKIGISMSVQTIRIVREKTIATTMDED